MAWEADKKAVLDGLVDDVSTHILVVSILISELNIIDDSQKNQLFENRNEAEKPIKFLNDNSLEAKDFAFIAVGPLIETLHEITFDGV